MDYYDRSSVTAPPPEQVTDMEKEYTVLPPEFGQHGATASGQPDKKRRLRQLLTIPAALLVTFLCLHTLLPSALQQHPEPLGEQQAGPVQSAEVNGTSASPSETMLPAAQEDPSVGEKGDVDSGATDDTAKAALPRYPLSDGTAVITVYNDTLTFEIPSAVENENYITILAEETVNEADFTSYTLPEPLAPSGYAFSGWVIHVNNPFDLSTSASLEIGSDGEPLVDSLLEGTYAFPVEATLTREDLEQVPVSSDGVRYVNVHAVWIESDPTDPLLLLDDGFGGVTVYSMSLPMASEGYIYLCRYPIPVHDGAVFDGWYNEKGERVELLISFYSFAAKLYDGNGDFVGYDWKSMKEQTLTAHWRAE